MGDDALTRIDGDVPLVLVAPHGGRRDAAAHPWDRGGLRTNDLHTAELTRTLARAISASAVVNDGHDRNRVDLNRIDQISERCPAFLDALHETLDRTVARHGRATLLTIHGWNTTAPVLDLGLGCRPGRELAGDVPGAAVSAAFATRTVPALRAACAAQGLTALVGRRYPARAPQNLIQLFTGRWRDDERDGVARVARFTPACDAMQLELGIPLRWPGPWRDAFLAAIRAATPALLDPAAAPVGEPSSRPRKATSPEPRRLDFVSDTVSGLVGTDERGERLLLVGLHDGLDLFTHDRVDGDDAGAVGALAFDDGTDQITVAYDGPIGRYPDRDAFLDLEAGLARATLARGEVRLTFRRAHAGCPFGVVRGRACLADAETTMEGPAFLAERGATAGAWLALDDARRIALRDGGGEALLCDRGRHRRVPASVDAGTHQVVVEIDSGAPLRLALEPDHRIPIVRGRTRPATTVALATYRSRGRRVGWGQGI